jgi:hypothetical protein
VEFQVLPPIVPLVDLVEGYSTARVVLVGHSERVVPLVRFCPIVSSEDLLHRLTDLAQLDEVHDESEAFGEVVLEALVVGIVLSSVTKCLVVAGLKGH